MSSICSTTKPGIMAERHQPAAYSLRGRFQPRAASSGTLQLAMGE
ncbi:hypothetical protein SFK227_2679 [Shigella flexneri K-227]|uniref:Uncharacterized protein n=1 Tax=Shigella flexneri K-227 TaxID=766147 RepID=F5NX07_SHIFL|nr:hypothetical protein SFK227_2679 [Shigella flexneri K-227]